jgi:hypothetical protein
MNLTQNWIDETRKVCYIVKIGRQKYDLYHKNVFD